MADALVKDSRPATDRMGWVSLLFVAISLAAYSSSLNGGFVWDDGSWTGNLAPLLRDVSGLWRIWTDPEALQQYYPMTGTTFWLDHQLWGGWTLPYHVENVLLHACSALLFWSLLRRLRVPGALLAGAIFAVHPVMVESVAWITERKNVLSLFFFLGAALAYGGMVSFWEGDARPRSWAAYGLALLLFACALFSKVTAFAFPAVILLLCWWKRGRIRLRADLLPVLPFFALAVAYGLLVAWLEKHHVGTETLSIDRSWLVRCIIAGRAFWFYPGKLLWPASLCFVYPEWRPDPHIWWEWLPPIFAVLLLVALWLLRGRWGRGPAAAVFFYVGTLSPVLGFMNVFGMFYSCVWDHWVYVPSLGLFALLGAALAGLAARVGRPRLTHGILAVLLLSLAVLSWRQGRMYRNMVTLWETTLERNPACWMAHTNLGIWELGHSQFNEAASHFEQAIKLRPDLSPPYTDLGVAFEFQGRLDDAISQYQMALKLDPDSDKAHRDYASVLIKKGRGGEALTHLYYRDATVRPGQRQWGGLVRLASILGTQADPFQRDGPIAVRLALQANEMSGGKNADVLKTLAAAYAESGRFPEAIQTARQALALAVHNLPLTTEIAAQLKLYEAGLPYHEPAQNNTRPLPIPPTAAPSR